MITIDDTYRLSDFGLKAKDRGSHPLTPEIENKRVEVPGKIGAYYLNTQIKPKPIIIPLQIIGKNDVEIQEKLNQFIMLITDDFGKPRNFKISYDYEPDKFYMVRLEQMIDIERLLNIGLLNLVLIAEEGCKFSQVYSDEINWGSETLTFESFYSLGHEGTAGSTTVTSNTTIDLTVSGMAVEPLIEIIGSADSLKLAVNGYEINIPSFTNATWLIDCEKYKAYKNDVRAFNDVKLRKFILLPGQNQVSVTGSNINIDINFKYRDKYL